MAKAEAEAPRGDWFYAKLAEVLKQNDVTHWTHLLEVDPSSLTGLDSAGKASARRAVAVGLPLRSGRWDASRRWSVRLASRMAQVRSGLRLGRGICPASKKRCVPRANRPPSMWRLGPPFTRRKRRRGRGTARASPDVGAAGVPPRSAAIFLAIICCGRRPGGPGSKAPARGRGPPVCVARPQGEIAPRAPVRRAPLARVVGIPAVLGIGQSAGCGGRSLGIGGTERAAVVQPVARGL